MSFSLHVPYAFLITLSSQPLHLSSFSLDEFEHAIRHSAADQPCPLLAEVHSTLIYNLRTVGFQRHGALLSLLKRKEEIVASKYEERKIFGVSIDDLIGAMADVGNNWERVPLRHTEGRDGWEDALVGCLKDVGTFITSGLMIYFNPILSSMPILRISQGFKKFLSNYYFHRSNPLPRLLHQVQHHLHRIRMHSRLSLSQETDITVSPLKTVLSSCPSCVIWWSRQRLSTVIWNLAKSS